MSIWNTSVDWNNRNFIVIQTDEKKQKKLQIGRCRSAVCHANSGKYFPPCLEANHWGSATIFRLSNPASFVAVDLQKGGSGLKYVALTNFLHLANYSHNSNTRPF